MAYSESTIDGGTYARPWLARTGATDYQIVKQQIWLDSGWPTLNDDADIMYGKRGFSTYLHEIGHTLGLSHPGPYDASLGPAYFEWHAEYVQDTRQYTVMSYFGAWQDTDGAGPGGFTFTTAPRDGLASRYASTPMLHDVYAIQMMYGADMSTRNGPTTYGFNSNAGRDVFDFDINPTPVLTIWDGGGIDTLDASEFVRDQVINLNPGTYSSLGRLTDNVAIAYNSTSRTRWAAAATTRSPATAWPTSSTAAPARTPCAAASATTSTWSTGSPIR